MSFDQNLPDQRADKESAIFILNQRDQKLMYNWSKIRFKKLINERLAEENNQLTSQLSMKFLSGNIGNWAEILS